MTECLLYCAPAVSMIAEEARSGPATPAHSGMQSAYNCASVTQMTDSDGAGKIPLASMREILVCADWQD